MIHDRLDHNVHLRIPLFCEITKYSKKVEASCFNTPACRDLGIRSRKYFGKEIDELVHLQGQLTSLSWSSQLANQHSYETRSSKTKLVLSLCERCLVGRNEEG